MSRFLCRGVRAWGAWRGRDVGAWRARGMARGGGAAYSEDEERPTRYQTTASMIPAAASP